jgi:hypothetical protein
MNVIGIVINKIDINDKRIVRNYRVKKNEEEEDK